MRDGFRVETFGGVSDPELYNLERLEVLKGPDSVMYGEASPGGLINTPHHFNVFLRGTTPVTARLLKPSLINAESGQLTDTREMPLHIKALFLSRPLHFGDYGGLPLKIIWALLDGLAIVVLGSGIYLWLTRGRQPVDARITAAEISDAAACAPAARENR